MPIRPCRIRRCRAALPTQMGPRGNWRIHHIGCCCWCHHSCPLVLRSSIPAADEPPGHHGRIHTVRHLPASMSSSWHSSGWSACPCCCSQTVSDVQPHGPPAWESASSDCWPPRSPRPTALHATGATGTASSSTRRLPDQLTDQRPQAAPQPSDAALIDELLKRC